MAIFLNRLSFLLIGGTVCSVALAPAIGQQALLQPIAGQPSGQSGQSGGSVSPILAPQPTAGAAGTGSGVTITLDYLSTLRYDENLGLDDPSLGSTSRWENTLALGVVNQTPISTLTFNLSGLHRFSDQPTIGSNAEFNDPTARLSYTRNTGNSSIAALAEYRETNLTFNQSLTDINQDGIIDNADIIIDRGTRASSRAGLTWQTGINDPLGFIFNYNRRERDYQNTTDPGLFDNLINDYTLTALMRLSPVLQGNVRVRYTDYTAEDVPGTDRQTTTLTTGVTYDASAVTKIDASVGVTQVDETLSAVPSNTTDEDFVASFAVTRDMPNGTATAQIDRTFGTNGDRTNATVGRALLLPTGTLDFSVGATYGASGRTTAIGDITYVHTLPSSQVTASLRRQVGTSTQSVETKQTLASLDYDYLINPLSSVTLGVAYVDQENEGSGSSNRRQRSNFNAAYNRVLTENWSMTVGYQYSYNDDAGPGTADSNAVYVTLGRQFLLKP